MSSRERPIDRGRRIARHDCDRIGQEIRTARRAAGRSIRTVAHQAGLSPSQVGRIERGELRSVPVDQLARVGATVGLDIRVHAYPGPDPTLDAGQLAVIGRFRARLPSSITIRLEVLLPDPRDQRAWDVVLDDLLSPEPTLGDDRRPESLPVDVDTRIADGQAQLRRLHTKRRDAGAEAVLWVLADTPHDRAALASLGPSLLADFPVSARQAMVRLRLGRHPGGSAILMV